MGKGLGLDCRLIPNVISGISPLIQPSPFKTIPRFASLGKDPKMEFTILPKQESSSKSIELFITDPKEGFHRIEENVSHVYYRWKSQIQD